MKVRGRYREALAAWCLVDGNAPGFNSWLEEGPFRMEFACSPHACVGFLPPSKTCMCSSPGGDHVTVLHLELVPRCRTLAAYCS